ncbi:hypothetical protein DL96DRAFT_844553 [Flagelloscypha sp. PMI_526]|nr:hypothetical protein DL96DRAFT_844553 [Flagelloscypha sp. PMI_526]
MITFFDVSSTLPAKAWSPNTLLTRFSLEFKGLPFKTQWLEYPNVAEAARRAGALPTGTWPDGKPYFSVPFIVDSKTNKVISDSWKIVLYLDETYPETRRLIPKGNVAVINAFINAVDARLPAAMLPWTMPQSYKILNDASKVYFKWARESTIGMTFEQMEAASKDPKSWEKLKDTLNWLEEFAKLNEADGFKGGYFVGGTMTYADIFVGTKLLWWRVYPEESCEILWKVATELNDGRWGKLMGKVERLRMDL